MYVYDEYLYKFSIVSPFDTSFCSYSSKTPKYRFTYLPQDTGNYSIFSEFLFFFPTESQDSLEYYCMVYVEDYYIK